MANDALNEIKRLVALSQTTSLRESVNRLTDAAKLCLEQGSQAQGDYSKASYRHRASLLLNRGTKIKALLLNSWKPAGDPFDMAALEGALARLNSSDQDRSLKEPSNNRHVPKSEYLIMLRASKIHGGTIYKPWEKSPNSEHFSKINSFSDQTSYIIPPSFLEEFIGWFGPETALRAHLPLPENEGLEESLKPEKALSVNQPLPKTNGLNLTMHAKNPMNLVQDAALDCSLVAGLCALVGRSERGHPSLLNGLMFPYDTLHDCPALSENGRYIFKFYFNGSYRVVEIDHRLPVSNSNRVLYVTDRNNPTLLWPALLEKAYLKLRVGGYDWDGSNSAADLWIITGWIPELIILQDPYPEEDDVWSKLFEPFHNGDALITLGTRPMSRELEEYHGLIGNHSYAVLDLKEENGERMLLIKNPWCESPDSSNEFGQPGSTIPKGGHLEPGHFWMPLSEVFREFRVVYVNWNPAIFKNRQDLHFNWDLRKPRSRTLATSPQFSITSETGGSVWLVLGRHLQDGPLEPVETPERPSDGIALKPIAYPRAPLTGYISMFMLDRGGTRCYIPAGRLENSQFVDGLQTFFSFKLERGKTYTLAVKGNGMPCIDQNFTLSAYSLSHVNISHANPKYAFSTTIESQWSSSMFCVPSKSGLLNPQFLITVPSPTSIAAFLDCEDDFAKVNLKLCKRGGRILNPKRLDILAESHLTDYELGGAWLEIPGPVIGSQAKALSYTLLVLNMDEDFLGKFALRIETDVPINIEEIPWMYSWHFRRLEKAIFSGKKLRIAAPMLPCALGDRMKVLVRFDSNFIPGLPANGLSSGSSGNAGCQSLLKITLETGFGAKSSVIATTSTTDEEFHRVEGDGLLLDEVNVWRAMTIEPWDLFLVIERSGGCTLPGSEERFIVDLLTERKDTVSIDKWRGWDD